MAAFSLVAGPTRLTHRCGFNFTGISRGDPCGRPKQDKHGVIAVSAIACTRRCPIASFSKTIKEIGKNIFLSVRTVSTYRVRALEKMRMKTNAEPRDLYATPYRQARRLAASVLF
jgi:hypothetical protein